MSGDANAPKVIGALTQRSNELLRLPRLLADLEFQLSDGDPGQLEAHSRALLLVTRGALSSPAPPAAPGGSASPWTQPRATGAVGELWRAIDADLSESIEISADFRSDLAALVAMSGAVRPSALQAWAERVRRSRAREIWLRAVPAEIAMQHRQVRRNLLWALIRVLGFPGLRLVQLVTEILPRESAHPALAPDAARALEQVFVRGVSAALGLRYQPVPLYEAPGSLADRVEAVRGRPAPTPALVGAVALVRLPLLSDGIKLVPDRDYRAVVEVFGPWSPPAEPSVEAPTVQIERVHMDGFVTLESVALSDLPNLALPDSAGDLGPEAATLKLERPSATGEREPLRGALAQHLLALRRHRLLAAALGEMVPAAPVLGLYRLCTELKRDVAFANGLEAYEPDLSDQIAGIEAMLPLLKGFVLALREVLEGAPGRTLPVGAEAGFARWLPVWGRPPVDEGATAAAAFQRGILSDVLAPIVRVAQLLTEAAPRELGHTPPLPTQAAVDSISAAAAQLGHAYRHLPLYGLHEPALRASAEVVCVPVTDAQVYGSLGRPPGVAAGTLVRVPGPLFHGAGRARVLILMEG